MYSPFLEVYSAMIVPLETLSCRVGILFELSVLVEIDPDGCRIIVSFELKFIHSILECSEKACEQVLKPSVTGYAYSSILETIIVVEEQRSWP